MQPPRGDTSHQGGVGEWKLERLVVSRLGELEYGSLGTIRNGVSEGGHCHLFNSASVLQARMLG